MSTPTLLASNSFTNQNLASIYAGASYTNASGGPQLVYASVRLSALNGAAANIGYTYRHQTSGGSTIRDVRMNPAAATVAKFITTDTFTGLDGYPILLATGEKVIPVLSSTNGSDTAASGTVDWYDANAVGLNAGAIVAASFAAGAIDAAAIADNAIDAGALAADCITAAKIATDAIGSAELAASAASEIGTASNAAVSANARP